MQTICNDFLSGLTIAPYSGSTEFLSSVREAKKKIRGNGGRLIVKAPMKFFFPDHVLVLTFNCS